MVALRSVSKPAAKNSDEELLEVDREGCDRRKSVFFKRFLKMGEGKLCRAMRFDASWLTNSGKCRPDSGLSQ